MSLRERPLDGPLILEEFDTTIVVPPGWRASLDAFGNIMLDAITRAVNN
jgi:N-methylhydantoinase A